MPRGLPYFKFDVAEWINGNITLEDHSTQGVFINACAFYWGRSGDVSLDHLRKRFRDAASEIDALLESGIIEQDGDRIAIKFLDAQFGERVERSARNRANGKKGGRPRKNPEITQSVNFNNPNERQEEEKRREEKRKEEDLLSDSFESDEKHSREMVKAKWNDLAESVMGVSPIKAMSADRWKKYNLRMSEYPDFWAVIAIELPALGAFALTSPWFGFDWLVKNDNNFAKFAEGNYRDGNGAPSNNSSAPNAFDSSQSEALL